LLQIIDEVFETPHSTPVMNQFKILMVKTMAQTTEPNIPRQYPVLKATFEALAAYLLPLSSMKYLNSTQDLA
jgi:hypothetical protein